MCCDQRGDAVMNQGFTVGNLAVFQMLLTALLLGAMAMVRERGMRALSTPRRESNTSGYRAGEGRSPEGSAPEVPLVFSHIWMTAWLVEGTYQVIKSVLGALLAEAWLRAAPDGSHEHTSVIAEGMPDDPLAAAVLANVRKKTSDGVVTRATLYDIARMEVVASEQGFLNDASSMGLRPSASARTATRWIFRLGVAALVIVGGLQFLTVASVTSVFTTIASVAVLILGARRSGGETKTKQYLDAVRTATIALRDDVRRGKRGDSRDVALAVALEGWTVMVSRPEFFAVSPPRPTKFVGSPHIHNNT
jgi:hypothetical protein